MASPPPGSTASSTHRCGRYLICPACTRISRGGGECRRTRGAAKHSTSAAPPSILGARGGCSTPSEHLLAPIMPSSTASQSAAAAHTSPAHLREMRPRRECGQLDVAASPGYQGHRLGRRPERHISRHMGEALPALGRLDLPPARNRGSQPPGSISQPRRPAWRAGRADRPRLFGGCPGRLLLAVRHSNPRASRSVPTFPYTAHTHISAEHESTRNTPQRRPGGTAPAANRCT